jgi:hypothetical protein
MPGTVSGPVCTADGDYVDSGTTSLTLNQPPGPVCIAGVPDPSPDSVPEPLRRTLDDFESTAVNFASRFIPDNEARQRYMRQIKEMSESVLEDFRAGNISAADAATLANRLRNEIMETTRNASSDVGAAYAVKLKAKGRTMVELQDKYASELFSRSFSELTEAEQGQVYLQIVEASGRADPAIFVKSAKLAKLSKGLLFVTVAVAVYQVATSDRPGRETVKQGAVIGAGAAGASAAGVLAATGLLCGPGAPVCVGIIVFVGGALTAYGTDALFDWLWN